MMRSAIYEGIVGHLRRRPFHYRFRYPLFSLLLDLDEIDALAERIAFFSHNRTNLVSFHDNDHGPRDGSSLRSWLESEMRTLGIVDRPGAIRVLCLPRILGYAFNPLTVWFIDDGNGTLRWVLYEIHNTFGESHSHFAVFGNGDHRFLKRLHVSPFFDVSGGYRVRISEPAERFSLVIEYRDGEDLALTATLTARRSPLRSTHLVAALARYPFVTVKVIAAIYLQAATLWLKGARYRRHPQPPLDAVSPSTNMVS